MAAEFGLAQAGFPSVLARSTVVGNITGGPNLVVSVATSNPHTLVAKPLLDDKPPQIIDSDIAEPVDVQLVGEWPACARSEGFCSSSVAGWLALIYGDACIRRRAAGGGC